MFTRIINNQDILVAIVTVTILFTLFSAFTVIYFLAFHKNKRKHRQQIESLKREVEQQLLQAQVEVQESTYRHIAKDLHDNVGQLLSTTKMLMGVTELRLGHTPDTLLTANATISKAIQEIRLLSRSLDREWLSQFNFFENLKTEMDRISMGGTIRTSVECTSEVSLEPSIQIILFRIVQEAIQNAVRHAQPSHLNVVVRNGADLEVTVINDGRPLPANFSGMGTNNMRHRAQLFGGGVDWQSLNGHTVVKICLPINQLHENQGRSGG